MSAPVHQPPAHRWLRLTDAADLGEVEHGLAVCFDGLRDPAARRAATGLDEVELVRFTEQLVQRGLLLPGRDEPLPVPFNRWRFEAPRPIDGRRVIDPLPALVPSSVAGTLAQPGLIGDLRRPVVGYSVPPRRAWTLPVAPAIWLGQVLSWPLRGRGWALLAGVLLLVLGTAVWGERQAFIDALGYQWLTQRWMWTLPLSVLCVHLVSQSAVAATVAREVPGRPTLLLALGKPPFPYLRVRTDGRAEAAALPARLRMTGSALVGTATLLLLSALIWRMQLPLNPMGMSGYPVLMVVATASLLLRLNPLARYDGYSLLGQWLGQRDLREQAIFALAGVRPPWLQVEPRWGQRALRAYLLLSALYVLGALTLVSLSLGRELTRALGGAGAVLFIVATGVIMYKQLRRPPLSRDSLGWESRWQRIKGWRPTRKQLIWGVVLLLLALFPYRQAPGGRLEVLPLDRGAVHALVAGDVREVLVAEGDVVTAGQPLVRLASAEQRARVAASEANLSRLQADLALLDQGASNEEIELARSRVATMKKREDVSRATAQRVERAYRQGGISVQEYERAQGSAEVDGQLLAEAELALELLVSPAREERRAALLAEIRREEALLVFHREELGHTELRAPIAGRVVSDQLKFALGRYLEKGRVFAHIEDVDRRMAEIRVSESAGGQLQPGRRATARVWAYPGKVFKGQVTAVAPAAEGDRYGRVLRVQVMLDDPEQDLSSGMTGRGKVEGERQIAIWVFTKALWRFLLVEVWSWLP